MSGVQSPAQSPAQQSGSEPNGGYPEQRHAGAVGYGPEYGKGASTGDKLTGMKEEVKGKIFHKPELVEHGHELRTGALKQKQMQEDFDPFNTAKDPSDQEQQKDARQEVQAATTAPAGTQEAQRQAQGGNSDNVAHMG